jgi:catechol 2,3-dioxygenase-like lactoylglutathione lyase family enzyme
MERVIGLGGIFFKSKDPERLSAWYRKHLGLNVEEWGGVSFQEGAGSGLQPLRKSHILWSPFPDDTDYFGSSEKSYMINFRVHDLHALLAELRREGVEVEEKTDESEFGKFGWIMDPDGTRIELWEPPIASA